MLGAKYFSIIIASFFNLFTILIMGLRVNYLGELFIFTLFFIISMMNIFLIYKRKNHGLFGALFFILVLANLTYIKYSFSINPNVNVGFKGFVLFGITLFLCSVYFLISCFSIKPLFKKEKKQSNIKETIIEPRLKEYINVSDIGAENPYNEEKTAKSNPVPAKKSAKKAKKRKVVKKKE